MSADASGELSPDDLEHMADAAWWTARPDDNIDALERAYSAHLAAGNRSRAAFVALSLAREYAGKRSWTIATGLAHARDQAPGVRT
jgi:hypothetical protein